MKGILKVNDNTVVNNIIMLLKQQHRTQKELTEYLGITPNAVTDWKSGRIKSYTKHLSRIADFFGVSTDCLLGAEGGSDMAELSMHEKALIIAYRTQPEIQTAVDRLLGIEANGYVNVYAAAHSEDEHPDSIIRIRQEQWKRIKEAPETDETLI